MEKFIKAFKQYIALILVAIFIVATAGLIVVAVKPHGDVYKLSFTDQMVFKYEFKKDKKIEITSVFGSDIQKHTAVYDIVDGELFLDIDGYANPVRYAKITPFKMVVYGDNSGEPGLDVVVKCQKTSAIRDAAISFMVLSAIALVGSSVAIFMYKKSALKEGDVEAMQKVEGIEKTESITKQSEEDIDKQIQDKNVAPDDVWKK